MTRFLLVCAFYVALVTNALADQTDKDAIQRLTDSFVAAWNHHDAKALSELWATDGSLITSNGQTATNRQEVDEMLRNDQTGTGAYRQSTYEIARSSVQVITPTVAVADWQAVLGGVRAPHGATIPTQTERVTIVLKKENGEWKFAAFRPGSLTTYTENTSALQPEADAAAARAAQAEQAAESQMEVPVDSEPKASADSEFD